MGQAEAQDVLYKMSKSLFERLTPSPLLQLAELPEQINALSELSYRVPVAVLPRRHRLIPHCGFVDSFSVEQFEEWRALFLRQRSVFTPEV